jgi:rod shape-determining protein MreB
LPKTIEVTSAEIREALNEPISAIIERVKSVLEQTPPELSSDIIERGMMLTGGCALLRGLDKLLASQTGIPIHVAEDPLSCVALGCGRALDQMDIIRDQFIETGFE